MALQGGALAGLQEGERKSKHFALTHNNYNDADVARYRHFFSSPLVLYAVIGFEVAPTTGTPHLQIHVSYSTNTRKSTIINRFPGAHVSIARDPTASALYAGKGPNKEEFGDISDIVKQGKRTDFDNYKTWLMERDDFPSERDICLEWPSLYGRYGQKLIRMRDLIVEKTPLEHGAYRAGWQARLAADLASPADDRKIYFIVDERGGHGKTWFVRKYLTENHDGQMFGIGKRDDLAYAVDETKRVFFVNVPRGNMQYLQYGFLESLKDRLVFSPKYASGTKQLHHTPHVVVMCNEKPDRTKLTADRFKVWNLISL